MPSFETVGISLGLIALTIVITRGLIDYCDKKDVEEDEIQTGNNSFTNMLCCTNLNIGGLGEQSNR
jgi:hypothetical protein